MDVPAADLARVHLLGSFSVEVGAVAIDVAPAGQRVLAVIALLHGQATRSRVAGTLWPDHPQGRALANLRGALWRLPPPARGLLDRGRLAFVPTRCPIVDLDVATATAQDLFCDGRTVPSGPADRLLLTEDLLPDWDDEWLIVPRERYRQLRLHALEALAAAQLAECRPLDAVDTIMAAVESEPLRESTQMLLLRAHLAAGNRSAALVQFERFRQVLVKELQVEPSREMVALVRGTLSQ